MPTTPEKKYLHDLAAAARKALRGKDRTLAALAATERAFEQLRAKSGLIGLYVAFGDELHPGHLIDRLAEDGRTLALPATPRWGHPLAFRLWAPGDRLVKGRMNIPEPAPESPEVSPDIVVVPPVAFDRRCYRVGYGAGFYDRTLPALRALHPVFALGFAFACQEIEAVPDESHDVPLDAIATESELIVRADWMAAR
jgi:5-formyltetrahydrofolate cyclo-ligase